MLLAVKAFTASFWMSVPRKDHVQTAAVELLALTAGDTVTVEHDHDLAAREGGVVAPRARKVSRRLSWVQPRSPPMPGAVKRWLHFSTRSRRPAI